VLRHVANWVDVASKIWQWVYAVLCHVANRVDVASIIWHVQMLCWVALQIMRMLQASFGRHENDWNGRENDQWLKSSIAAVSAQYADWHATGR